MIPKDNFSPQSRFVYDVIYRRNQRAKTLYAADGRSAPSRHQRVREDTMIRSTSDPTIGWDGSQVDPDRTNRNSGLGNHQVAQTSLKPAPIPEAYRRRRRYSRRSTSSLPASTSSESDYRVRTKYPEFDYSVSGEELSRDVSGLDLAVTNKKFHLENIWVVPHKDHIKDAIGRRQVHFKLEQSIQELDEIE
ncbi:hypothetical protein LSH36_1337g00001 [Paralvinella palmiformis]|uniref:Uncharacterized protein n=1 Tax=Paralvinella palmiformis TaxID=53620 RepID=A0AAD9IUT4_9ANNE|nr:hypothetical protein LSH36_1337g00001 [Paralvinella palmiformis]